MVAARAEHTATPFYIEGHPFVLLAGGDGGDGPLAGAEVFLPGNRPLEGQFAAVHASLPSACARHAGTVLPGSPADEVLLTGGWGSNGDAAVPSVLRFVPGQDPVEGIFEPVNTELMPPALVAHGDDPARRHEPDRRG